MELDALLAMVSKGVTPELQQQIRKTLAQLPEQEKDEMLRKVMEESGMSQRTLEQTTDIMGSHATSEVEAAKPGAPLVYGMDNSVAEMYLVYAWNDSAPGIVDKEFDAEQIFFSALMMGMEVGIRYAENQARRKG